ncbi:TolC family protein [Schlesneria sp.]|uniref:TolC family protein n=1 Tax=Schlesneria sp. TaxID=2762018 RepID=UPI002F0CC7B4
MSWRNGSAMALIFCLAGCASSRTNTLVQRDHSPKTWHVPSKDEGDRAEAASTPVTAESADGVVTTRKVRLSKDLVVSQDPAHTQATEESSIRSVSSARTSSEPAEDRSTIVLAADSREDSDSFDASEDAPPEPTGEGDDDRSSDSIRDRTIVDVEESLPPGYPLSLDHVLSLADAQNPNVAFARERILESYARVDRAQGLWLPSLRAGANYYHHEGEVQDVLGNVFSTNKTNAYGGLGASAGAGSGSPTIPGVVAQFHTTDAIFQPRITEHQAASRQFGATAARNDVLRNTAVAYLELLRAEQSLAIAEEALFNTKKLAELTGSYAETGQGLRSDYERMLAEQGVREAEVAAGVEGVRVASARLIQLLHGDQSVRISTNEPVVAPLALLDKNETPASLVATALTRRPELAEQQHLVCEAVERLNREKYAPLIPSVLLGMSYGAFGGGLGSTIGNTNDRLDVDALAFWEVRNLGVGERAARGEAASVVRQNQKRQLALMDQVAREVVEFHAKVTEREKRIEYSRKGIIAAERSYQLNTERIKNAQGLPIESLQSVQALAIARLAYLNAVIDYNTAQFELCRAIGWFENT